MSDRSLHIALVAGEKSGDHLGANLISALTRFNGHPMQLSGVGGEEMMSTGLTSLFPLEDVAVMGPLAIAQRLPKIVRRVYQTVDHIVRSKPDVLVIIDSPEFTHPIARRVRKRASGIPIVDYVSPSVWAWRPGRAAKMRPYVDHILAVLPFEPDAHRRLGGPACTYVGHPLIERIHWIRNISPVGLIERLNLAVDKPTIVVLPGSRTSEVKRLMPVFAETMNRLHEQGLDFETIIPAVPHVRPQIEHALVATGLRAHIVEGETAKFQVFRFATCALAASGTVTLELALAGTPMVVAYTVDAIAANIRHFLTIKSVVLPNLILDENAIPELLQEDCTAENLAGALKPLVHDTPERRSQTDALGRVSQCLRLPGTATPSEAAAKIVYDFAATGRNTNQN